MNKYIHIHVWAHIFVSDEKKHHALLTTCERTIAPGGCVLVFYTHHRPHLAHRDMEFFKMAGEMRWECEKVFTERFPVRVLVVFFFFFFLGGGGFAIHSTKLLILISLCCCYVSLAYVPRGLG